MALPKKPADGENSKGFRSVGPNGDNRDPTQPRRKNNDDVGFLIGGESRNPDGDRWGQFDRGDRDDSGAYHDW